MNSRDNVIIVAALVLLSVVAWIATVHQAGDMEMASSTMSMTMGKSFSLYNALLYIALWGVMMVAMMFPSVVPMASLFATVTRKKQDGASPFAPMWLFVAGYGVLWTLTGGVAYAGDIAIQSLPHTFPGLRTYGTVIGGGTLVVAGLYQLTPLKYICLSKCRSPFGFLLTNWREGRWGAFRMGVQHGFFCLGCCWSLMTVLFVVGTMNLVWMGVLTLIIFLEKILPNGVAFGKGTGLGLIGLGILLAVSPSTLGMV